MTDEHAHFLITIYELCLAARLGGLSLEINGRTGERAVGVPAILKSPQDGWPCDGTTAVVELADTSINFEQIAACTIFAPAA